MRLLFSATAGLMLWAASFSILYALQGSSCALGWDRVITPFGTLSRLLVVTSWCIFVGLGALTIGWATRLPRGLEQRLGLSCAIIGFVAIIVTGSPVLIASTCVG